MVQKIIESVLTLTVFSAVMALWIWAMLRLSRHRQVFYLPNAPLAGSKVYSGDRKLQVSYRDSRGGSIAKNALLWQESRSVAPSQRQPVLLQFRSMLREIEQADAAAGLIWCTKEPFPELNRLAIWLLGRSGGTLGASSVIEFYRHPDVRMRREVARALVRMRAWVELAHLATIDSDSQVRRLATPSQEKEVCHSTCRLDRPGHYPSPSIGVARPNAAGLERSARRRPATKECRVDSRDSTTHPSVVPRRSANAVAGPTHSTTSIGVCVRSNDRFNSASAASRHLLLDGRLWKVLLPNLDDGRKRGHADHPKSANRRHRHIPSASFAHGRTLRLGQ